jgi:hypothetical protein
MAVMESPLETPFQALVDEIDDPPDLIWKVVGTGAGLLGAIVARKVLDHFRERASSKGDVPLNPADERMSWPYALAWAGIVGIAASLGRLVSQLIVAQVWKRKRGRPVAAMPS